MIELFTIRLHYMYVQSPHIESATLKPSRRVHGHPNDPTIRHIETAVATATAATSVTARAVAVGATGLETVVSRALDRYVFSVCLSFFKKN